MGWRRNSAKVSRPFPPSAPPFPSLAPPGSPKITSTAWQKLNPYVDTSITFKHFFVRKTMFMQHSQGIIVCPGGFGTFDEMFEALTLVQTHKAPHMPIVLFEKDYWQELFTWLKTTVLDSGMISTFDPGTVFFTNSEAEAVDLVTRD